MNILVLGGTRFFGVHMVDHLLKNGHTVTIATRGNAKDNFGDKVYRKIAERTSSESLAKLFTNESYDVICDNISYCSNDVQSLLSVAKCHRYVMTSTCSVYHYLRKNTVEEDFNALTHPLEWCGRDDFPYPQIKRQAECALFQAYPNQKAVAVRFPFVIGPDDYTKRLFFYVEHIINKIPMNIDNLNSEICFIDSDEAGRFLAYLAEHDYTGSINGCSTGRIAIREIIAYVEDKTKMKAILSTAGENAPYNGADSFDLSTKRAEEIGFQFTKLSDWIFDLLDTYIEVVSKTS